MVTIRYFAGARQAAGVAEEKLTLAEPLPLNTLLERLVAPAGQPRARLAAVLSSCSFLLNEVAVTDPRQQIDDADQLDVLPPFAGG